MSSLLPLHYFFTEFFYCGDFLPTSQGTPASQCASPALMQVTSPKLLPFLEYVFLCQLVKHFQDEFAFTNAIFSL